MTAEAALAAPPFPFPLPFFLPLGCTVQSNNSFRITYMSYRLHLTPLENTYHVSRNFLRLLNSNRRQHAVLCIRCLVTCWVYVISDGKEIPPTSRAVPHVLPAVPTLSHLAFDCSCLPHVMSGSMSGSGQQRRVQDGDVEMTVEERNKISKGMAEDRRRGIMQEIRKIQPETGKNFKDLKVPESLYRLAADVAKNEEVLRRFTKVPVYDLLANHAHLKGGTALADAQPVLEGWKAASSALFRYALNLVLAPKRPEFKKMKVSSVWYSWVVSYASSLLPRSSPARSTCTTSLATCTKRRGCSMQWVTRQQTRRRRRRARTWCMRER